MSFDPRITPARPDLAAGHLKGQITAARYAEGVPMRVAARLLDLRLQPERAAPLATQLLHGEGFTVFETRADGLSWGQSETDAYVGYVGARGLEPAGASADARVTALSTHVYPAPDMKIPSLARLPFLSRVRAEPATPDFRRLSEGRYCPAPHLGPIDGFEPDPVTTAERFLGTPYLWGGRTSDGIDCSGLVQLALIAAGLPVPRDSDMQAALGTPLSPDETLRRGDLILWKGHIGLMRDAGTLLHATAHAMAVVSEPLADVTARIAAAGHGPVLHRRRL